MFNAKILKAELVIRGENLESLAKILGINKSTVSKKLNGKSEWTLSELQKLVEFLGRDKFNEIFFTQKVSFMQLSEVTSANNG